VHEHVPSTIGNHDPDNHDAHNHDPDDAVPTGDAAVDEALTRLGELSQQHVREHVAAFDAVHTALQDRLADTEE